MTTNQKFTLLVTLKDRSEFSKRLYEYLAAINYPFPVLFADGSLSNENEQFFESLGNEKKIDFTYIRYSKDSTLQDYYKKCADAVSRIKTPYVMMADNDDFPCVVGQKATIDFLENHPEYIGCNGEIGGFIIGGAFPQKSGGKNIFHLSRYSIEMDRQVLLNHDRAVDRIHSYLENFYSLFYSTFRTSALKKTLKKIHELDFSELGIHELFLSYYQLAQGKVHSIPVTTYIRQQGSSQSARFQKDWFDRVFYTEWLKDFKTCISVVAEEISRQEEKDKAEIEKILYEDCTKRLKKRFIPNTWYIFKNMDLLLNSETLRKIFLGKVFAVWPWLGEKLSLFILNKYFKDAFKEITPFIKSFPKDQK